MNSDTPDPQVDQHGGQLLHGIDCDRCDAEGMTVWGSFKHYVLHHSPVYSQVLDRLGVIDKR